MKTETKKVVPTYTKTAKKIAKGAWEASGNAKVRAKRTKIVEKSLDEFCDKIQKQALHMFMVLRCGYGVRSPEFKVAKKEFNDIVKVVERGCATANAWLELANANKKVACD